MTAAGQAFVRLPGGFFHIKEAMKEVEARLERNPILPKWDILIRPA
jgi:hypothetical protein